MEPGAVAAAVAREAGIHASHLYRWRQELCDPARVAPGFTAVTIAPEPTATSSPSLATSCGLIEIELASGARLRISGAVDAALVSAALTILTGTRR